MRTRSLSFNMKVAITTFLGLALLDFVIAEPGVSPAFVKTAADPGAYLNIDKVVTTSEILPKPDVVLLVDITTSMSNTIKEIKTNLDKVINAAPKNAEFAVASFGDIQDTPPFKVVQDLTSDTTKLHAAVDGLKLQGGGDPEEDWINALWELAAGAVSWRTDSSRIIVLISDNASHDPSGGHTLDQTIEKLTAPPGVIRIIAVNTNNGDLDKTGQATKVTLATGGVVITSDSNTVTQAIINGLKNLDVTVKPDVVSCDKGVTLAFDPATAKVASGGAVVFHETATLAQTAPQRGSLACEVRFLLNDAPGGDAFVQRINVTVNQL
jgi:hypothetical protein